MLPVDVHAHGPLFPLHAEVLCISPSGVYALRCSNSLQPALRLCTRHLPFGSSAFNAGHTAAAAAKFSAGAAIVLEPHMRAPFAIWQVAAVSATATSTGSALARVLEPIDRCSHATAIQGRPPRSEDRAARLAGSRSIRDRELQLTTVPDGIF
eukprot:SAG31_NODE_4629_length_3085_cov_2.778299_1_plen_153_part_00